MPLRALVVTAALAGIAAPAVAHAQAPSPARPFVQTAAVPAQPGALTLENAAPLPVPPPPKLQKQQTIKAPPQFVAPKPIEPPPLPAIGARDAVPPPAPVTGAPPTQTAARPAPPPASAPSAAAPPPPAPVAAAPKPAPAPAPTQTAALPPPAPVPTPAPASAAVSVLFSPDAADLPDSAEPTIAQLAERMRANESLRLQLRSYAGGTPELAREARQLSLARALALRERLTAFGIRSTRIDIRALGIAAGDGPPDRIDAEFMN